MVRCSNLIDLAGEPALTFADHGAPSDRVIVLLHSLGADHRFWRPQIGTLTKRHRVLVPEARGHGGSAWRPGVSVDGWVSDIARLLDHVAVRSASLVGVSLGGVQALAFALQHPDRTERLILADTFAELPPDLARRKVATMVGKASELGMRSYADSYVAETFTTAPPAADAEFVRDAIASMDLDPYVESVRVCFGVRYASRLAEITAPTLVLWGERDSRTPRVLSEQLAAGIPAASLRVVPDAGHLANLENPTWFSEAVQEHLSTEIGSR